MDDVTLEQGNTLKKTIDNLTAAQTTLGGAGVRAHIRITNQDGSVELLSSSELSDLLTSATYDTICATAKTTISTDLSTAKSTAQTSYDALTPES